jgi:hypothetical protein
MKQIIRIAVFAAAACTANAQFGNGPFEPITATTITNASGTISQVNYDESGATVQTFLVGTNIILSFPSTVCAGVSSLGVAGNSVTYSGTAITFGSGFQSVTVSSFTNNTTKATYTKPSPSPSKPTAYPATAGVIDQLNYDTIGEIDGFVFTPTGSTTKLFVDISPRPNSKLTPLLKVGATVTVAGFVEPAVACPPAGTITEVDVDATSLTFGTTTVNTGFGHGQ